MPRWAGIDEAGYGPDLGPLCIGTVAIDTDDPAALDQLRDLGVADSKTVHRSGDLSRLERVALPLATWCLGRPIATYADLLAGLGHEHPAGRHLPWQVGADALRLPVAAGCLTPWQVRHARPALARVDLLHPAHLNACRDRDINRAAAELAVVLDRIADCGDGTSVMVDRLGGRKFYRDCLQARFPDLLVVVASETTTTASYRLGGPDSPWSVGFAVGADASHVLVAAASCLAKYLRELDMLLLNAWFAQQVPGLTPTAGYPEDAARWLRAIDHLLDDQAHRGLVRYGQARRPRG